MTYHINDRFATLVHGAWRVAPSAALCRAGYHHRKPCRADLELLDPQRVKQWFIKHQPQWWCWLQRKLAVFMPMAPTRRTSARESQDSDQCDRNSLALWVRRLLFLGSSCICPKFAEQPIKEEALLTGPLEPTNEWYAIAKISGIKLCEALRKQPALMRSA